MSTDIVPAETTHRIRDHCLCLHAQRAARALARRFDTVFRPLGLTNGQFSLLMSLNRPHPAPMRALVPLLGMDRTTLTAALKPLQRRGLVGIAPDPADRRGRLLSLTASGRILLAAAVPIWEREHAALENTMAAADGLRAQLRALGGQDHPSADENRRKPAKTDA